MTDLTEKWKNGKLKSGSYYLKLWSGATNSDFFNGGYFGYFFDEDIEEILAPVPSYEEWEEKQKALKVLAEAYCKEKEENNKLEKLLKKVRCYLLDDYDIEDRILLCETIDEVLNDK